MLRILQVQIMGDFIKEEKNILTIFAHAYKHLTILLLKYIPEVSRLHYMTYQTLPWHEPGLLQ